MKKSFKIAILASSLIISTSFGNWSSVTAYATTSVSVDPTVQNQTWDGWGTSLAWWGNVIGGWNNSMEDEIVDKLFNPVTGIGLNMVRYNIGGGENPTHTHMDARPGAEMPGFKAIETSPYNWSADENQISILRAAKAKGVDTFEAFSNSAPYWMTINNCASGSADGGNNLKPDYYDDFATYLVDVLKHFRTAEDITFSTIAPLNEPVSTWWRGVNDFGLGGNNQEGMHFDRVNQEQMINQLATELANQGEQAYTKISAPEEYNIDNTYDSYNSYSASTKANIERINTHSYGSRGQESNLRSLAAVDGKSVWISEYGNNGSGGLQDIDASMVLSNTILSDIKGLKVTGWNYWQAVEDSAGDNNYGLMKANFTGPNGYTIAKKYYGMGNYSKYIKQGYKIIQINNSKSLAAYDPESHKLVIVTTNDTSSAQDYTYDLSLFDSLGSIEAYRTSATENLASVPASVTNKQLTHTAQPRSITTYIISDALYSDSGVNLLSNPGFETGDLSPWLGEWNASLAGVEPNYPLMGVRDAYLHPTLLSDVAIYQTITAPSTKTYTLTAYAASNISSGVQLGVNVNGVQRSSLSIAGDGSYAPYKITFNASEGQNIKIWYYSANKAGWATLDQVILR